MGRRGERKLKTGTMRVSTHIYINRQSSGIFHLEKIKPQSKKEFAESIVRSLDGLDLCVGGACNQPTVLAVAGW